MTDSAVPPNRLRQRLAAGKTVIGTMLVEIRQPSIMTMLANAGFDFVIIDNEHGSFNVETIADLSRAARDIGVTPVVRLTSIGSMMLVNSTFSPTVIATTAYVPT